MNSRPGYLSISEAAKQMGVTSPAVYNRIQRGTLPAEYIDGQWCVPFALLPKKGARRAGRDEGKMLLQHQALLMERIARLENEARAIGERINRLVAVETR